MRYTRYVSLSNLPDGTHAWPTLQKAINTYLKEPIAEGADSSAWKQFFVSAPPMKAYVNAPMQQTDFPLVFLMHGNTADYSLMGEYLASKGMVVVQVAVKGYAQSDLEVNAIGLETEIRDYEFVLQFLQQKFGYVPTKAAAIGMSFGGQSALGMAIRNPLIKCVISLDGGIGSSFGGQLLAGSHFYKPEFITMPILHLYNPDDPGGSLSWFDEYKYADRFLISWKNMMHAYFLSYGHLSNSINKIRGKDSPVAGVAYEAILAYTATFIEEAMSGNFHAEKIQTFPDQNVWLKQSLDKSIYKKATPPPLRLTILNNLYAEQGIEGLEKLHHKEQQKNKQPISMDSYRNLFQFILNKRDSVGLLRMALLMEQDFPEAALPMYYHGRALQLTGKNEEGLPYLRKALLLLDRDVLLSSVEKETFRRRIGELLK
jgi:dienelactone hydrolase